MPFLVKNIVISISILASMYVYSGPVIDGKKVANINSELNQNCTYFKLEGVTGTSSARSSDPWFAVPISSPSHDTVVSILLAAYMSGKAVRINVNEADTCNGKSGINYVRFSE